MIFKLLFLVLLSLTTIFATTKNIDSNIADSIASSFYELNEEEVGNILKRYMEDNDSIKYIALYDSLANKKYLLLYKDENDRIIKTDFEKANIQIDCNLKTIPIIYQNDTIGKLEICSKEDKKTIELTKEEKAWINAHPVIKVHNEYDWAPFNFNKNNTPLGYSIDYIKHLAQIAGIKVEFITGTWNALLEKTYNKEIDVMLNIARTKEREKHLLYVGVYAKNVSSILTKEDRDDITNIESLFGKKVSVIKGFVYEKFLKEKYPKIQIVTYPNTLESIKAVVYGEVDATLGKTAILNNMMNENVIKGLKYTADVKSNDPDMENLYIAVRNDAPQLQSILKKAMRQLSLEDIDELKLKWFNQKRKVNFTQKEYKWLDKKRSLDTVR